MAEKENKTNAIRRFDSAKIPYTIHRYEHGEGAVDGAHIASLLGIDPAVVYKTLVTRGSDKNYYVFDIPVLAELDLKKAAVASKNKKVEMTHMKELLALTGYIRGGCSPVGMKKKYPTYIDETCILFDEIAVSAGQRGVQVILDPQDLIRYVGAAEADVTKEME